MEYVIVGAGTWLGASVLAAAGWSRFYDRIVRDHARPHPTSEVRSRRNAAHVSPSRRPRVARVASRRVHSRPAYA